MAPTFDEIRDLREEWEATLDHTTCRERVAEQIAAMSPGQPGRAELLACASFDLSIGDATRDELSDAEEPTSVDRAGEITMEAHFRLGQVSLVSPRMYVLDNFVNDGKVYVGYIGPHLRNTQTN